MYQRLIGTLVVTVAKGLILILLCHLSTTAVPKGSQAPWSKIESGSLGDVNLFGGSLNFGIPLLNISGRGDTNVPLTLRLGKQWKKYVYTYVESMSPAPYSFTVTCVLNEEGNAPSLELCVDGMGRNMAPNATNPQPARVMIFPSLDNELDPGYGPGFLVGKSINTNSVWCNDEVPLGTSATGRYRPSAARFSLSFFFAGRIPT